MTAVSTVLDPSVGRRQTPKSSHVQVRLKIAAYGGCIRTMISRPFNVEASFQKSEEMEWVGPPTGECLFLQPTADVPQASTVHGFRLASCMKATCSGLYNFSGEAHLFSIGFWNTEVKTNVAALPRTHTDPSCRTVIRRPIIGYVIVHSELTVYAQVSPAMAG
jgi:hypothetical protein